MSVFQNFTNQYSLSKTLRFELKPVGKTLESMKEHLQYDPDMQTFLKDQNIEDAYQVLKPVLDAIHEDFITQSLESEKAKQISFAEYLSKYQEKVDDKGEKKLREEIGKLYEVGEKNIKSKYGFLNLKWKKGSSDAKGAVIMETQDMLEVIRQENLDDEKIQNALNIFKGFFTYFSGFNQNRKNYYETGAEKATAVATRIIHENLPKFCDNLLQFEAITKKKKDGTIEKTERKEEYKSAYQYLKDNNKTTQIKDAESGQMIEAEAITEEIFDISYFVNCLSQKQIEEYNRKIGHYNSLINLYNQAKQAKEKDVPKDKKTFRDLPKFRTLFKQIGCGEKKALFFALTHNTKKEAAENKENHANPYSVEQILELVKHAGEQYFQKNEDKEKITIHTFQKYILEKEDYNGVYWSKSAMNTISNNYFANFHDLKDRLKTAKVFESSKKGAEEEIKIPEAIELFELLRVIDGEEKKDEKGNLGLFENSEIPTDWKTTFFKKSILENEKKQKIIQEAQKPSEALLQMIFSDVTENAENFLKTSDKILKLENYSTDENKAKIKEWMDYALTVNQILKYFLVKENKIKKGGNSIDPEITEMLNVLVFAKDAEWFKWYDALRNFLTKKPQDSAKENKLKLNFENSTLAAGWDLNKESDNTCVLLQNPEGKMFLAIMPKTQNMIFKKEWTEGRGKNKTITKNPLYEIAEHTGWQKMEYKLLPGPNKMLPKCLLPGSDRKKYGATDEILKVYDAGTFKKSEKNFSKNDLGLIIDFYKSALKKYTDWECFNFSFRATDDYEDISQFYGEVEKQGYKLSFESMNKEILDSFVESGKIYLFEITNKDFNDGKKEDHQKNLHTLYWNAVFQEMENRPKLNGEAEIFYRRALKKEELKKENWKGKEIIKEYRFSKEKFLFHVPITLNFCLSNQNINTITYDSFSPAETLSFLGIDRGEKHLAYYAKVDEEGKMIEQNTLNLAFTDNNGNPRSIEKEKFLYDKETKKWNPKKVECYNYNDLLDAMASNRDMARKNWQTIGTIKNVKEGYISQVIRTIADLSTDSENPAFIVLEDLNTGFKRGRQKIEKSLYQKFELALAKKLNFLVNKNAKNGEVGSVTNALQLTPPVQNYGDIENRKQVGIMLYTRANYTSQTDPLTGWRKTIYLKSGSEESIKAQILEKFSNIFFDGKDYVFEYAKGEIVDPKTGEVTPKIWKLYSGKNGKSLARFRGERGQDKNVWEVKEIDIIKILDGIFEGFDKEKSLLEQLKNGKELKKINEHTAWESLRFVIDLIQQIRNTGKEGDERNSDFIYSPVRDENGNHFDSREYFDKEQKGEKVNMPTCGDANGAYNIARKGMIMNEHIKTWIQNGKPKFKDKQDDLDLFISEAEWDLFLIDREEWKRKLSYFSSRKTKEKQK